MLLLEWNILLPLRSVSVLFLSSEACFFLMVFLAMSKALANMNVLKMMTAIAGAANAQIKPFSQSSQQLKANLVNLKTSWINLTHRITNAPFHSHEFQKLQR